MRFPKSKQTALSIKLPNCNNVGTEIHTCIVIPCYNEEKKIPINEYISFIEDNPTVLLCFVNDGSNDNTLEIINSIKEKHREKVDIFSYSKNAGKAEAVRQGIHYCNSKYNHSYIAYLDADLSTTLQECIEMKKYFINDVNFCFGSRIQRIGAVIERKFFRFLTGRIIATFISNILKLKVYDTQCGCKLFSKDISVILFEDKFISRWLFDVEIFFRMIILYGRKEVFNKMIEIPLSRWIDKGDSKVKLTYFFKLWYDLYRINKKYKRLIQAR